MSDALVLYPRAAANIKVLLTNGERVESALWPDSVRVSIRPHHQASECEITVKQSALPFDPRKVADVLIRVYMGAMPSVAPVNSTDTYVIQSQYLRFIGHADTLDAKRSGEGPLVTFKCRDISAMLRDEKNLYKRNNVDPIPAYQDSLRIVIERILGWAGLDDGDIPILDLSKGKADEHLTKLVSKRGQSGRIPIQNGYNAWQVIEHCAALANLMVIIHAGELIIRDPIKAFVPAGSPEREQVAHAFVFGEDGSKNGMSSVKDLQLKKKFLRNRKGVRLVTYDPKTRRQVFVDYPTDNNLPPKQKRKLYQKPPKTYRHTPLASKDPPPEPDRDVFPVGPLGVHDLKEVAKAAERIYLERSRQELEGELNCGIWSESLLGLKNADRILIKVKPDLEARVLNTHDRNRQVALLRMQLNLSEKMASALLDAVLAKDSEIYYVRSIEHDWNSSSGGSTKVDFIGIIEADLPKGS